MDSLIFALSAVAPIVLTVVVGYFFKKIGMMDEDFAKKANKLVFRAFMPVMLFVNIYKMSISDIDLGFIGYCLIALFIIFAISIPACMMIAGKKDSSFVKKHTRLIFVLVNVTIIGAGLTVCVVKRSVIDVLPILGVLFHTCAFWLSDERVIRRVSLAGSPFWLVYNFISRAYGSAIGDVLTIVSILSAMFKYREKDKNQEPEEEKNV